MQDCPPDLKEKMQKLVDEKFEDEKEMMACMVCKNVVMNPLQCSRCEDLCCMDCEHMD